MRTFALVILLVACAASASDPVKGVRTAPTGRTTGQPTAPTARPTAPTARPTAPTARPTAPTARPTGPTARPTTRGPTAPPRAYDYCYDCGGISACPQPFRSSSVSVTTQYSYSRWCEKISPDNGGLGPFLRGVAIPGDCYSRGCYKAVRNNQPVEICCCRGDYCNTGVVASRSASALIFSTLALLFFFYKF